MNEHAKANRILITAMLFVIALLMISVAMQSSQIGELKQFTADQDAYLYDQIKLLKQYVDDKQPEYIIIPETIYVPTPGPSGGLDG